MDSLYKFFFGILDSNSNSNSNSDSDDNSENMNDYSNINEYDNTNDKHKKNKKTYNDTRFYYLSLLKEEGKSPPWSIHGLWPQYDEKNYPVYCKKVTFSIDNIKHLLPQLEECWYSDKGTDEDFWKHEWEKHGSCVFTPINETTYFSTAIRLFYSAISKDLPEKYYDEEKQTCLIPVNLEFKFMNS